MLLPRKTVPLRKDLVRLGCVWSGLIEPGQSWLGYMTGCGYCFFYMIPVNPGVYHFFRGDTTKSHGALINGPIIR